jgi:hypothetical protein
MERPMTTIAGIVLIALAGALFVYSMPRDGKVALFVGTQWEPYVTILIIACLGVGVLIAVSGIL